MIRTSVVSEPASVGSSSRRSGGAARIQRAMPTTASASPIVALKPLSKRSIVLARSASAEIRNAFSVPGGKGRKNSHTSWPTTVPKTKPPTIARSTQEESRPLGKPRTSAANGGIHQFAAHWPSV